MSDGIGQGQADLSAATSDFNRISFLVEQALRLVNGATLVQVKACTNSGGLSPIGTVDVQPLVNLTDGAGTASSHGVLYKLPYSRLQGGKNAVIIDPVVGDIGLAVFADQDISSVKKTQAQANPGTFRRNDMADGLYLFSVLSQVVPTQYIEFLLDGSGNPNGINIADKFGNTITMGSAGVTINGVLIDRSQNVSGVHDFTNAGNSNLSGATQFIKLADGSNSTKVKGT